MNLKPNMNEIKLFDDFIPEFARKLHIQYKYKIIIHNKYHIYLYSNSNLTYLKPIILYWLDFFYKHPIAIKNLYEKPFNNNVKINLYIALYPNKRIFTNDIYKLDYIPKTQINGGVTYKYYSNNKINTYIYRSEEFERVLIHELIHTFHLDKIFMDIYSVGKYNEDFKEIFINDIFIFDKTHCRKIFPYYFEIYTQSLTIYFIIYKYKYKYKLFLNHLIPICKKIIDFHNKKGFYDEETSILSYFFGVSFILCNWNEFEKYIEDNNISFEDFLIIIKKGKIKFIEEITKINKIPNNIKSLKLTPTN